MNTIRLTVLAGAAVVALGARAAESAVTSVGWTNLVFQTSAGIQSTAAKDNSWGVCANWTNAEGEVVAVAPTNAADRFAVSLPALGTTSAWPYHKTLSTGGSTTSGGIANGAVNPSVCGVSGGERYTILHAPDDDGIKQNPPARLFSVADPNDFYGSWQMQSVFSRIQLTGADGTFKPILRHVTARYQSRVGIPAGGTGRIDVLDGDGGLWRIGAGDLEIGATSGGGNKLTLDGNTGTVTLGGVKTDGSDLAALLARAVVHLDASVASSFVTSNGDDRVYVRRWNDCRANGQYAYVPTSGFTPGGSYLLFANAPYVSSGTAPTGLKYLDFGSQDASAAAVAKYGPTNCMMRLSETDSSVREVFYVARHKRDNLPVAVVGSKYYPLHPSGGGGRILSPEYAAYAVKAGDLRLNGRRVECSDKPRADEFTSFHVFSSGTTGAITISQIGTDRERVGYTGGVCVGEVLLFDEPLTVAERVALNRYLRGKWLTGESYAQMFGPVVATADTTIEVPEGQTARIETLHLASGKKLTKTGGGILEIGQLGTCAGIVIGGGEVRLPPASVTTVPTEPVAGATYWLDASKADHFTYDSAGNVATWKDQSTDAVVGTSYKGNGSSINPTVVANAYGTLSAVSFGIAGKASATASYMRFPNWKNYTDDAAQSRTGFIVFRFNAEDSDASFFCSGSSNIDAMRNYRRISSSETGYVRTRVNSAHWTLDGLPIETMVSTSALMAKDTFFVVAFDSDLGQFWQGLACDRDGGNKPGGVTIGEVILYNRRLSAAERRANEAYLMQKWQGRAHPASVDPSPSYQFGDDMAVAVDGAGDVTLSKAMGNGSIYKAGDGTLTVPTDARTIASRAFVTVAGGTLETAFAHSYTIDGKKPFFHFDASRPDRMTYYASADGVYTNVTEIRNTYNGTLLKSALSATGSAVTNPALVSAEMRTGLVKPCWDFGVRTTSSKKLSDGTAAFSNSHSTDINEFHVIFADKVASASPLYQNVFCSYQEVSYYPRGGQNLLSASAPSYAKTGYLAIDGDAVTYDTPVPTGFHLISAAPNVAEKKAAGVTMTTPCLARMKYNCGGCQIAEVLMYSGSGTNTPVERAYVQESLMHKWFGGPVPRMPFAVDAVSVASGATWSDSSAEARFVIADLTLAGSAALADVVVTNAMSVVPGATVTGGLAFEAGAVLTVAELSADTPALAVGGTLTLRDKLTVNILPDLADGRLARGTYPLFAADAIVRKGADAFSLADLEVVCPERLLAKRNVSTAYDATTKTVLLVVRGRGTVMTIK